MSLAHAILGLLRAGPATGYELKTRCFDGSIAHFWPADQTQIYRTLKGMAARGWVESEIEIQVGRPNRNEFRLTSKGENELDRWLVSDLPPAPLRDPFLIQVFFGAGTPDETLEALLDRQARQRSARLAELEAIPLPPLDQLGAAREYALQRMTLDLGLELERAHLAWITRARDFLLREPDRGPTA